MLNFPYLIVPPAVLDCEHTLAALFGVVVFCQANDSVFLQLGAHIARRLETGLSGLVLNAYLERPGDGVEGDNVP